MRTKILFLALSVTLLVRCNDDTNLTPTEKIKTSVWVSIVDASGNPVKDAQVAIGEHTGLTDVDGNYFFSSVLGNTDMFLKAEKFGFFPGSRRFYPSKNKIEYVNINLLPYIEKGVFNTASPVVITVDSKSSLTFPDIAVAHENGSLYSGEVHVMANSIYADDPDLSKKMPGNLTGINDVGNSFVLGSYGMLAVELQDGSGQKLQITPGKFAEIRISIPPNMLAAAPITIPLWYFDEKQDMWKEEGHADKIGNEYVGKVGHFSFWNCDDRFPAINWDISLIYKNGKPASGLNTSLTIKKSNSKVDGASNEAGLIKTIVPANEILIMEINDQCGNSIYSKEIGPYANDHSEGIITLPETSQVTTITGSAFDCNNNPVTKGFLRVNADGLNYVFNLEAQDGLFEESFLSCVDGDLTVRVIDETRTMSSLPLSFPSLPSLSVGNITVCDSLDQYIRFRVNGFNKEYIFRDLIAVVDENPQDDAIYIFAYDTIGYRGGFNFYLNGHSEGTYHNKATGVRVNLPNGEYGNVVNLNTTVTYLGKVEDFIEGTFDGQITAGNNGAGGNGNSDFSGSFVVKRSK